MATSTAGTTMASTIDPAMTASSKGTQAPALVPATNATPPTPDDPAGDPSQPASAQVRNLPTTGSGGDHQSGGSGLAFLIGMTVLMSGMGLILRTRRRVADRDH
ncbi:MAG: hypothetical protein QM589_04590 [Thermomicrobiales bacterium]